MWLSIRLPQLPLETLCLPPQEIAVASGPSGRIESDDLQHSEKPFGVVENNRVICINPCAYMQGVRVNQSLTSAYALCDSIQLLARNSAQEQQTLASLAMLLYRYSPQVVIDDSGLLLLELRGSLKLYQGLENILASLSRELAEERHQFQLGLGHTPKSATLLSCRPLDESLACWQASTQTLDVSLIESKLAELPVELMAVSEKIIEKIHSVGFNQLADLAGLPMGAIRKRFGENLSNYLQKLYGRLADPQSYFIPAESFYQKLEFIDVIHHRQGLLFPIKRLVQDLCRFLTVKQKNCQSLRWELFDSDKNLLGFDVLVTDSLINEKVYIELTQLNLERYSLHAPIEAIALTANQLCELTAANQQLFEQSADFKNDTAFINKIRARLGHASCYMLEQKAEHVPELASRQIGEIKTCQYVQSAEVNRYQNLRAGETFDGELPNDFDDAFTASELTRPSWLLEQPQPINYNQRKLLWHGELQIVSAQERITSYWWKKKVARDYYLAEHDDGTLYWVFYDQLRQQWFLHGIYS